MLEFIRFRFVYYYGSTIILTDSGVTRGGRQWGHVPPAARFGGGILTFFKHFYSYNCTNRMLIKVNFHVFLKECCC